MEKVYHAVDEYLIVYLNHTLRQEFGWFKSASDKSMDRTVKDSSYVSGRRVVGRSLNRDIVTGIQDGERSQKCVQLFAVLPPGELS